MAYAQGQADAWKHQAYRQQTILAYLLAQDEALLEEEEDEAR